MKEDGQAEKEDIPLSKRMKSDHSKIQFGTKVSTDEEIAKASKGFIRLPQSESTGRYVVLIPLGVCVKLDCLIT